nr:hypothetical protein Itr_chr07CG06540 [Ipomoea trifida]
MAKSQKKKADGPKSSIRPPPPTYNKPISVSEALEASKGGDDIVGTISGITGIENHQEIPAVETVCDIDVVEPDSVVQSFDEVSVTEPNAPSTPAENPCNSDGPPSSRSVAISLAKESMRNCLVAMQVEASRVRMQLIAYKKDLATPKLMKYASVDKSPTLVNFKAALLSPPKEALIPSKHGGKNRNSSKSLPIPLKALLLVGGSYRKRSSS